MTVSRHRYKRNRERKKVYVASPYLFSKTQSLKISKTDSDVVRLNAWAWVKSLFK